MVLRIGMSLIFDVCVNCRWSALKMISRGKFPEDLSSRSVAAPEKIDAIEKTDRDPREPEALD